MKQLLDEINKRKSHFRSLPFWSWNDKLEEQELISQVDEMNKAGIGGFFMHARGGLITEYLSDEWFEATKVCIEEAKKNKMQAWCYDENGWPSGFASGKVCSKGYDFQEKCLLFVEGHSENDLGKCLGYYIIDGNNDIKRYNEKIAGATAIHISVNQYYIDALNEKSIKCFIEETHEKYYEHFKEEFGNGLPGFFTDEPQFSRGAIPWTDDLPALFKSKYGYDIIDDLMALKYKTNGYAKIRNDFWNLVNELFTNNFIKQLYEWCDTKGCALTGHLMSEDNLFAQMSATAGVMPSYEYLHIPGIDWLGRFISSPVIPKQVSSVGEQLGRQKVITETFALCGWDVSFEELKWIAQWQYVNGINTMCQHLEGYTLRGFRKRDYPPSLFIQQSWWDEYKKFNDYFAKLGAVLAMGKPCVDVLILHPLKSAYVAYDLTYNEKLQSLDDSFIKATTRLNEMHIEHHYADETILKKYGSVKNKKIQIGECEYSTLILPELLNISANTLVIIKKFIANGGQVINTCALPIYIEGEESKELQDISDRIQFSNFENDIIKHLIPYSICIKENNFECGEVHYRSRILNDGKTIYYFVNNDKEKAHNCLISISGFHTFSILDLEEMKTTSLKQKNDGRNTTFELNFLPMQSYIVVKSDSQQKEENDNRDICFINLKDEFIIEECSENALTLDFCTYKVDDEEWQPKKAIILLQKELLDMQKTCQVSMRFNFKIADLEDVNKLYLVLECPEKFEIKINNQLISYKNSGYFIDKSFKKLLINNAIKTGENVVELSCLFYQNPKVYDVLYGKGVHESELNKLTFDTELESIYIVGDFSLKNNSAHSFGKNKTILTDGDFELNKTQKHYKNSDLTTQGLWFFAGQARLSQMHNIKLSKEKKYILEINNIYAPVSKIIVNKNEVKTIMWAPYEADVTEYLIDGENSIEIILFSSNRNLLGPHHFSLGESYFVGPSTFTNKKGWTENSNNEIWTDRYCFLKFGIE